MYLEAIIYELQQNDYHVQNVIDYKIDSTCMATWGVSTLHKQISSTFRILL